MPKRVQFTAQDLQDGWALGLDVFLEGFLFHSDIDSYDLPAELRYKLRSAINTLRTTVDVLDGLMEEVAEISAKAEDFEDEEIDYE